jgi:hypothetical protein
VRRVLVFAHGNVKAPSYATSQSFESVSSSIRVCGDGVARRRRQTVTRGSLVAVQSPRAEHNKLLLRQD